MLWPRNFSNRCCTSLATPSCWRNSVFTRCDRRAALAMARFKSESARALLAGNRGPFLPAVGRTRLGRLCPRAWERPVMPWAGRSRAAVRRKSRMHWALCLRQHGGEIELNRPVRRWEDLPKAKTVMFDVTAWQFAKIAGALSSLRLSQKAGALPSCSRRLQNRLRAFGTNPLESRVLPARRAPFTSAARSRKSRRASAK